MEKLTIDLARHGGPIFNGRPRGEAVRAEYNLDNVDQNKEQIVEVLVPDATIAITSSFVGGLLGKSMQIAGSPEKFWSRFHFQLPKNPRKQPLIREVLETELRRALFNRRPLLDKSPVGK